jgi:hypothetical protein
VKAEPAVIETINHPMGVVEQPAIPIIQPFEGSFNQGSMNAPVDMIQNQHHQQAPEPVQPAQALLPIPNEHLIIHDVFHTLKDKCAALASNAVRNYLNYIIMTRSLFYLYIFFFSN